MSLRWSWIPFALLLIILPFPGTVAARLLLLLICGSIALHTWWLRPAERMRLPFLGWLIPWLAVSLLSLMYAVDPGYSVRELQNEFGYNAIVLFSLFVVTASAETHRFLQRGLIFGLFLIGGWATVTWAANGFAWDETGRAGGVGIFATYLVTTWPIYLWLRETAANRFEKYLAGVALAFSVFLALITLQRVVLPVLAVQIGLALWLLARSGRLPIAPRQAAIFLVFLVSLASVGLLLMQQWRYKGEASEQNRTALAADIRLSFWPVALSNILEHPLTGAGFGRNAMRKAYPHLVPTENTEVWHAHNVVLNQGMSSGFPGMAAILIAFFGAGAFFWRAARNSQNQMAAIAGLLIVVGVLLRNQLNDFFVRDMSMLYWALIGLTARACLPACKETN